MSQTNTIKTRRLALSLAGGRLLGVALLGVLALLWLANLHTPMLSWDEGWTLLVARTWVEHGFYGRLLLDQPAPPGLSASFPSVASLALSFRFFGVGIWQGRLPAALYTLATLGVLFYLALRLYNRAVAWGTLFVLLGLSTHQAVNPLVLGRQVFAEPLQICCLLAGYAFFLASLRHSRWWFPLALLMWGLALITKAQTLPFWAASLLVPLVLSLFKRRWHASALLALALPGSYVASRLLLLAQAPIQGPVLPSVELVGLAEVIAVSPFAETRSLALMAVLVTGLPVLSGLLYATWCLLAGLRHADFGDERVIVRSALLVLAGSWFAWYALLSVGWVRYFFPAVVVGSIFAAAFFYDATGGYKLRATLDRIGGLLRRDERRVWVRLAQAGGAFLVLLLVTLQLPLTMQQFFASYTWTSTADVERVAALINTRTAPAARIESYDSELFFLLQRPYHYPPDQINLDLIRRGDLGQEAHTAYDPLAADPDYLVIGPFSRASELYDTTLQTEAFRLLQRFGPYDVYERVR